MTTPAVAAAMRLAEIRSAVMLDRGADVLDEVACLLEVVNARYGMTRAECRQMAEGIVRSWIREAENA